MGKMVIEAIKSKVITPQNNLFEVISTSLQPKKLQDGDIIVLSSKVVAITQGRVVKVKSKKDYEALVKSESDKHYGGKKVTLTKKDNIFIPWAGIDTSNIEKGYAVLWPEKPFETAHQLLKQLKQHNNIKKMGVIISDSYCAPLRRGVTAIALGYAGFHGVNDLRGKKDIHKNILQFSQQAVADMLASSAHLLMGESDEQTPIALIKNAQVKFTSKKIDPKEPIIPEKDCLFAPIYPQEGK